MEYTPHRWVMLHLGTDTQSSYKILAGWYGGYLDGDSWKLNSGCTKVESAGDYLMFTGYSGSIYRCHKEAYGLSSYTSQILEGFRERIKDNDAFIVMLPKETNFMELKYE